MSDTVYVDGVTLLTADSMNDLNRLHYTILADPANVAAVKATLHAAPGAIGGTTPAAGSFTNLFILGANAGGFGAGEWSRDANWGTYYKAPASGALADIGLWNSTGVTALRISVTNVIAQINSATIGTFSATGLGVAGLISLSASVNLHNGTAIPAGGTNGAGVTFSSTTNFGTFFGSGAPTLSAAKGSLYLRSNGSGTTDRAYINTDGGTTWTALTTAA